MRFFFAVALVGVVTLCHAQNSSFLPLRPPALPLAVRSPYMSTWQQAGSDGGNGGYLAGQWPTFWQGQVTGWQGLIKVDNETFNWMGDTPQATIYVEQTAFEYTSTRSIFTMSVGPKVQMKITFLSPVTPDDLLRSSLPYAYLDIEVSSLDGQIHSVQLYTDISAEWVSGDHSAEAQWYYGVITGKFQPTSFPSSPTSTGPTTASRPAATVFGTEQPPPVPSGFTVQHTQVPFHAVGQGHKPSNFGSHSQSSAPKPTSRSLHHRQFTNETEVAYHMVWRQQQLEFSESNQQANWGYWYYATNNMNRLTYQSGQDIDVRGQFISNGFLADTQDTNYRGINDDWPVFGFAVDLGQVSSSSVNTLFQLSLHQQNCIQFEGANGTGPVPCLWTSYFGDQTSAVEFFYNDYETGSSMSTTLDDQVASESLAAGGQNYLSLTSLAVRQAFGALEFTNTPDAPFTFLKEISSDGNIQTVDVIFPFHPIAVYMNPKILKYMLDPLFINQEAGNWPYQFSIHDLGNAFPNATGHNNGLDEMQPLEECGDMLIMTLAYAQRAQDDAYLVEHYDILKQWNNYLVNDSLIPMNQISTDDFAGALANQTNLAIKGIIGIEAMAQIANRTGHVEDGQNFTNIAHTYIDKWQGFGIAYNSSNFSLPHTTLAYNMPNTYSLLYNLYGDAELGLELVPQSVYEMQSNFYPTVFQKYGVPLDTRHTYTKADWQIFCASIASNETKNEFTSVLSTWLDQTPTNYAFTDLYDAINGNYPSTITFIARPVVGGMFTFLALESTPSSGFVQPI